MGAGLAQRRLRSGAVALAIAALMTLPALSPAGSARLGKRLCETTGGGRFVEMPRFPGERIDRRLLRDAAWLRRNFKIYVTDAYSTAKYHEWRGEHPIGLAMDILPDRSIGGSWRLIGKLARWAEPRQNQPRAPFRWVGYWKDKGHGPGDHLHLSWSHTPTSPRHPARTVWTLFCPGAR
jgi:hypothetical protein